MIARVPLGLLLFAALLTGCAGAALGGAQNSKNTTTAAPELARLNELLAGLVDRVKPALVHVRVRGQAAREDLQDPQGPCCAAGSGFIIDPEGVIVTSAHVVGGATWVDVRLLDGRRFTGRVVGRDRRGDLAVVRIEGVRNLPALPLGDSDRVRVGEFVLALGHPFGLEYAVSFGIVSRKGAPLGVEAPDFDLIQTDVAINPGNSGGPLVNMAGEAVGVNSVAARNGSIGFAVPSNLLKIALPQLLSEGHVEWGWLGVGIAEIRENDLERLKLREPRGVLICSVMPDEPAGRGGIRPDDVLLALDGRRLDSPRDLLRLVAVAPVGKKVRAILWRNGQETTVEVTLGQHKEPRSLPGDSIRSGPQTCAAGRT